MPREPWRDHPEYVALWRAARTSGDAETRLVLADWLEEQGHLIPAWHERLRGLSGREPQLDECAGTVVVGRLEGDAWDRLLAAPPPDELLVVFDHDKTSCRRLEEFSGRCGVRLPRQWHTEDERESLRSAPGLRLLDCSWVGDPEWDWIVASLPRLTHLALRSGSLFSGRESDARCFSGLASLSLGGAFSTAGLLRHRPALTHLSLSGRLVAIDELSLAGKWSLEHLEGVIPPDAVLPEWPALRSLLATRGTVAPDRREALMADLDARTTLERVAVPAWPWTRPDQIQRLARLPRLRELTLTCDPAAAAPPLESLADAASLERLSITGRLYDRHFADLAGVKGLRSLSVSEARLSAVGIDALARMVSLEELWLRGELPTALLPRLAALPRLERLDLGDARLPVDHAAALRAALPPWVEWVSDGP